MRRMLVERRIPRSVVEQQIVASDQTGDPNWVTYLIGIVRQHNDWVKTQLDPTDHRIDFALAPEDVAEYYEGDDTPIVVADGLVIDGSHRASAAWYFGGQLNVYIPASEL